MKKLLKILSCSLLMGSTGISMTAFSSGSGVLVSNAKQDQRIAKAMVKNNYYISSTNSPDVTNKQTIKSIFEAIRYNNSYQTDNHLNIHPQDARALTFSGPTLQAGKAVKIITHIGAKLQKTIKVTLQKKDSYQHMVAPYIDINLHPAVELAKLTKAHIPGVTLGFIQNASKQGVEAAWGGFKNKAIMTGHPSKKVKVINQAIKKFRQNGGQVAASFGGEAGTPIWHGGDPTGATVKAITKVLKFTVAKYHTSRLDFDIEGAELTDSLGLINLSKAINNVQAEYPKQAISLTIVVGPHEPQGINPVFAKPYTLLGSNLNHMPIINIMAMDYGLTSSRYEMGQAAIVVAKKTAQGTAALWAKKHFHLNAHAILTQHLGITPMLGMNDVKGQIFYKYDLMKVAAWAHKHTVVLGSFWDSNRDIASPNPAKAQASWYVSNYNSGLYQQPNDFANIWKSVFGYQS